MKKDGVRVEGIEEVTQLSLENLLLEKFRNLQLAREAGDAQYFDSLSQSIEVLLKANPIAYKDLMAIKEEMQQELEQEYINITNDANKAPDEIYRQHILESRVEEADWLYRITYEETLIEIFQKNNIIGMVSSEIPEAVSIEEEPEEPEEELDIKPPSSKKRLKIGKPKLMRQQEK